MSLDVFLRHFKRDFPLYKVGLEKRGFTAPQHMVEVLGLAGPGEYLDLMMLICKFRDQIIFRSNQLAEWRKKASQALFTGGQFDTKALTSFSEDDNIERERIMNIAIRIMYLDVYSSASISLQNFTQSLPEISDYTKNDFVSSIYKIKKLYSDQGESLSYLEHACYTLEIEKFATFAHEAEVALNRSTDDLRAKVRDLDAVVKLQDYMLRILNAALYKTWVILPNLPDDDVPFGHSEADNVEIDRFGQVITNRSLPHDELGLNLDIMDIEQTVKICGSRFVSLKGMGARLERALIAFMLDNALEHGYLEVSPPALALKSSFFGVGQLPKFADDIYFAKDDRHVSMATEEDHDKYYRSSAPGLISTAEVSLTNLVADKLLTEEALPLRYVACTPCFRQEAGSAGRDTKGMLRLHQFFKVELVSIVDELSSADEHERLTGVAMSVLKKLKLPFRVMLLSSGDMGFAASKTYDIEVWMPSQNCYREISSCSNCKDFQAVRMNARYKSSVDKKNKLVHTLNGSGLAVGRTLAALLENYQRDDGSIDLPDVLVPYMGLSSDGSAINRITRK